MKDSDYKNISEYMVMNMKKVGYLMILEIHFLHSYIEYLRQFNEEQVERFQKDLNELDKK